MSSKKRIIILSGYWFFALTFALTEQAWAYIDPATTTYLIQITAAVVITLGVSLSVFLYRFRVIVLNIRVKALAFKQSLAGQREPNRKMVDRESSEYAASNDTDANDNLRLTEEEALAKGIIDYPIPVRDTYPALAQLSPKDYESDKKKAAADTAIDNAADTTAKVSRWRRVGKWLWKDSRTFKQRLPMAFIVGGGLAMVFVVFGMLDSIITNETEVAFSLGEVIGSIILFGCISTVLLALAFAAFRGRVYRFVIAFMLASLIGSYLQSTFFNSNVGQLIGLPLGWNELGVLSVIINLLIWLAIYAIVFFLGFSRKRRIQHFYKRTVFIVPALLIAVQLVALFSILPPVSDWNTHQRGGTQLSLTSQNMYQISKNKNVVVFILDTLDELYIDEVVAQDPSFFDRLDGFTRFTNNVTEYNSTFPSIVSLMTNEPYDPGVTSDLWTEYAYDQGTFLSDIKEQGFTINLYMDKPYTYTNGNQLEGIADNLEQTEFSVDIPRVLVRLFKLNFLKCAPLALKSSFWLPPDILSHVWERTTGGAEPYYPDDPQFFEDLKLHRLDALDSLGHLKWYHLDGSHPPWTMDEYGLYDKTGTSSLEQTSGCFNILYEFFNQMKELGIYKDATIIITGDHPSHDMLAVPERPMLTGLFVKPAGEEGSALRYSNAPVSIGNLRATCVQAVGGDSLPWGKTYFEVDETDQISRHYYHRFSTNGNREHYIADYRITGDARDWSNWVLVGLTPIDSKYWWG